MNTDRIEKKVVLRASRSRIWRAITTVEEFNSWFGVKLRGVFAPGERLRGPITHRGYEHLTLELIVEKLEPERLFSYRWHPYAIKPDVDYSNEPTTLVEFKLEETAGNTELTVVESGFDLVPLARRAEAFRANNEGWAAQLENIARYVAA
jgi:uncharacterized protein YndB with AHSA1/START domain